MSMRAVVSMRHTDFMPHALDPLVADSAVNLSRRISTGDITASEVVAAHLDRIDAVNPEINAIVAQRPRADIMADAAAADATAPQGPLHGLPVAVKDLQDVAGLPTRRGSLVSSAQPAEADGIVAERLRAAGAIIIGKTNTPEFGTGSHTFNEVYGLTRNPWNLACSARWQQRRRGGSAGRPHAPNRRWQRPWWLAAQSSSLQQRCGHAPNHRCRALALGPVDTPHAARRRGSNGSHSRRHRPGHGRASRTGTR